MHLIIFNFKWMLINILLAIAAIIFGWIFLGAKNKIVKYLLGICWLLFLPNTIYLFTDLINLIHQFPQIKGLVMVVVIIEYIFLEIAGFITFILALYPFEHYLIKATWVSRKSTTNLIIIFFNFIIAFGITLGRVERINSWDVFVIPIHVINASLHIITSLNLLVLTLLFTLFDVFLYFLFREPILRRFGFIDKV